MKKVKKGIYMFTIIATVFYFSTMGIIGATQASAQEFKVFVPEIQEEFNPQMSVAKTVDKETGTHGDQVTYTMEVTNTSTSQTTPLDVMLVLDRLGSMSGTKIADAKTAAKTFVDQLNPINDKSGLASFNSSATLDQELTFTQLDVKNAIDTLSAGGGTDIADGINIALTEFSNNGRIAPVKPIMIVLSDGVSSGDPVAAATTAKAAGIRLISINLGIDSGTGLDTLKAIASAESDYYFAPDSSQLNTIYSNILDTLCDIKTLTLTDDITDVLAEADLISTNPTAVQNGNILTWTFDNVGCGETKTATAVFEIQTRALDGALMENVAVVKDVEENSKTTETVETSIYVPVVEPTPEPEPVVLEPILNITKSVDKAIVNPSDTLSYTVVVNNSGEGDAVNMTLTDILPSGLTFANEDGTNSGDTEKTWTWEILAAGKDVSVTYDVLVDSQTVAGTYDNIAAVSADNYKTISDKASTKVKIPVVLGEQTAADLAIEKTVMENFANPGNTASYTVKVTNTGDAVATNVVLTDVLPTGFVFKDNGNTSNTWQLGDIVPTETISVTYDVMIDSSMLAGKYINTASVIADNVSNKSDQASLEIRAIQVLGEETEEVVLPVTGGGIGIILAGWTLMGASLLIQNRKKD